VTDPRAAVAPGHAAVSTLRAWLLERDPPIPEALLRHLDGGLSGITSDELLETLLAHAEGALEDARGGEGERRGAFRLLAADAYVTYACEVALDGDDPAARLIHVVERVVREAEEG
jgi:hypothetical protein